MASFEDGGEQIENNDEDSLRDFIRESFIEEGVMDWLFSRWRKNGDWKGDKKISNKYAGAIGGFIENLEQIYKAVGVMQNSYPRKSKLIRSNLLRAIRDLEDLLISIERGRTEKDIDAAYPIR